MQFNQNSRDCAGSWTATAAAAGGDWRPRGLLAGETSAEARKLTGTKGKEDGGFEQVFRCVRVEDGNKSPQKSWCRRPGRGAGEESQRNRGALGGTRRCATRRTKHVVFYSPEEIRAMAGPRRGPPERRWRPRRVALLDSPSRSYAAGF